MKVEIKVIIGLLFFVMIVACKEQPRYAKGLDNPPTMNQDLIKIESLIHEKTDKFTQAHITKDTAFLNSCFAIDARVFPPQSAAVSGYSNIATLNVEWVNYGIQEFKEISTAFYGNEDLMIDEGIYHMRYGPDNAVDTGKYVNIWKLEDGVWKIYSNIWNTSMQ